MKIQPIKNQENHKTFNAKFCIGGDIKSIPKEFIADWAKRIETLGNNSDAVILHIGPRENFKFKTYLLGQFPKEITKQSRNIFAIANIKGQSFDKNLSYTCKNENFNTIEYLKTSIDDYINGLFQK